MNTTEPKIREGILDWNGLTTGVKCKKTTIIMPFVILALMLGCSRLPLSAYGEKTGLALGVFLSLILCYLIQPWDMVVSTLMVPVAGFFLGFWEWSVIQTSTGTSSFVSCSRCPWFPQARLQLPSASGLR